MSNGMHGGQMEGDSINFDPSPFSVSNSQHGGQQQGSNGRPLIPEVRTSFQPATYGDTTILPLPHNNMHHNQQQQQQQQQAAMPAVSQSQHHHMSAADMVTITKCDPYAAAAAAAVAAMSSSQNIVQQQASSTTATAAAAAAAATSAAVAAAAAAAATGGGSHPMKDAKAAAVKGEDSMCMGFRPCKADLAAKSEAELRRKGTNFLRHHASKHGIINSSRKRLDFVIKELSQHYLNVHKFALIPEPEGAAAAAAAATVGGATSTSANAAGGKTGKVKSASGGSALAADDKNGHVKQEPNDQQQNDVKLSQSGAQSGGHHANNAAFMLSSQLQDYQSYFQPGAHFLQSLGMAPPNNFPYQNPAIGLQPHQVQLPVHPTLPTPPQTTHTNGFILPGPAPSSGGGGGGGGGVNGGSGATAASSSSSSSLTQSLAAQDFQTRILNANSQNCQKKSKPVAKQQHDSKHHHHHHSRDSSGGGGSKPHFCVSPIVAKNKAGLTALGTSKLRPQASAHKVFNSSRRPKKEVVEELWAHYEDYHADEIAKMNSGAVGGSGSSLTEALMEQASSYHQHHHQQQQQQQHHHHGGHPHHASSTAHASSTGGGLAAAVGGSTATTSSSAASAAAAAAAAQRAFASAQVAIAPLLAANSGFNPGWVGHVAGDEDENSSQISNNSAVTSH